MKHLALCCLVALVGAPTLAAAQEGGWSVRFGLHAVNPKSDNGTLAGGALAADIDTDVKPTFAVQYHFTPNWSLDILAAVPFKHTVSLNGVEAVDLTHLPPTVSIEYQFLPEGKVRPFVGLGVNYTFIYDEEAKGPLAGTRVKLDNSFGLAAHAGLEFAVNDRWSVVADVRWMDIDTDVSVNGADVGTASVDPLTYGLTAMYRF